MDVLARADALHARAVEQYNDGRPASALRLLRSGLQLLDGAGAIDREADIRRARMLISVALNECELRGTAAGRNALTAAEELVDSLADPALGVLLECQRGSVELRAGQLHAALAAYDAAAALLRYASPRDRFSIRLNRGTVRLLLGELAGARRDLQAARQDAQAARTAVGEFKALHNLGYLEFLAGNLPNALELMQAAGDLDADVPKGVWHLDRARVLAEAGLLREADDSLAAAADILRRSRLIQDLAETELERARCALVAGDVAHARRLAGRARDRFRRRGNDSWRRSAELVLLQGDLAAGRPGRRLAPPALRLVGEFTAAGLQPQARTAALIAAEAHVHAGEVREAEKVLATVTAPVTRDPVTARLHHHLVHACLDDGRGRTRSARARIGRALSELARYQSTFGSIDLSSAAAVHGRRLAELDLAIALRTGRPQTVFHAAERGRSVTSRLSTVTPPDDPMLAEQLAELRQIIEALRGAENDATAAAELRRQRRRLEAAVNERRWTLAGSGAARPPARLQEVEAALRDEALALLVVSGEALHAVLVRAGQTTLVTLGAAGQLLEYVQRVRADLDVLAQPRLPNALRAAVHASYVRSLAVLDDRLVRPLHTDGTSLVVSATGSLGQLPWSDLPSRRGVPTVITPSATAWLRAATGRQGTPHDIAAFAGPDVGSAADELDGVRAAWADAAVTAGADATGEALTKAMATADLVHIAAHGVHQTENPLFSCLRMADGPVFAHEFDHAGRAPAHVVLSACELGLATVRPGDEALGLTSVLLRLGTRCVIAGVARVADDVAAQTMTTYHRRLAAGRHSAAALAEALAENDPDRPAPFVCFGATWQGPAHV